MTAASLLVEILTEELPPKSLKRLSESLAQTLGEGLKQLGFAGEGSAVTPYATPRRLAVHVTQVLDKQPDRMVERKGPSVAAGLDAQGQPTPALLGFAKSCGVEVGKLERVKGDKGEQFAYRFKQKGEPLKQHLSALVESSLKKLPVAKLMRWGDGEAQFVRPVHGVILLHGNKIVPGAVLGLKSGNKTLGHRFLSKGAITIAHADKYADILRKSGKVMADFDERRDSIVAELFRQTERISGGAFFLSKSYTDKGGIGYSGSLFDISDDATSEDARTAATWILQGNSALLDEVTAIVEWPAVYLGEFDEEFLSVPAQCIGLTMQKNQKYFALVSRQGELLPKYLLVSNLETRNPVNIVHGNARVLRARLADAKFFFEQDQKTKLSERVPRLASVVYHNKLGSQLERVQRLQKLAVEIARRLGADVAATERAAYLAKADLLTEMVGEFPELQGIMGYRYALHDGEDPAVAAAIIEHYLPRFAGDSLPRSMEGTCLSLADKLDTLVGIYGIGLVPTGDKDPFGLRRAALGVARILTERGLVLDARELLDLARAQFPAGVVAESVAQDLYAFLLDRLRPYCRERGFKPDEIEAVLALNPTRLDQVIRRLEALQAFRKLPEAEALAAANKRIRNILKQAGGKPRDSVDTALLREEAERVLAEQINARRAEVEPLFARGEFEAALQRLASLRGPVDTFFDKVMVMVEDEPLKQNRLALLNGLSNLFLGAADISRLQG